MKEKAMRGKPHCKGCRKLLASMAAIASAIAMAEEVKGVAGNPFSALTGQPVGDPHIVEWKGRLYMFAGHDFSPASKGYDLRDWWVWSTSDLVGWKLESVLKPEDTFLRRPFRSCWATFGVPFPDGWRYYFSAGPAEIGVVTAKTPAGPWSDPLGRPLVAKGEYRTEARDPDVLLDDDGSAYIVFGTFNYFIAKLGADGLSLAEKARPVRIDGAFGPYGRGKTDDKPSLHKRNGLYYLSWSSFYAVSTNVYGPYGYRGSVIDAAHVSPKFRRDRIELHYDRHGNFFQFNGQWYYIANDYSQPGRTRYFRDAVMGYVHYRDNGDIAPVRIDEVGVGQYDASRGEIEAEDFFAVRGAKVGEHPVCGFELRMGAGNAVRYPNIHNVQANATLEISMCGNAGGGTLEFREGLPDGRILGTVNVRRGRPGHFTKSAVKLQNAPGTLDLWIVAKGGGTELCRIDWFSFCHQP